MNYKSTILTLCFFCFFLPAMATVVYVDSSHVGGSQNGTSWATAFSDFQNGINAASAGDSVWVAKGTYLPPLANAFNMVEGVKIFGGFVNTNTQYSERNWQTNLTILKSSNVRVIVNNGNNLTNAAVLDGFTITGNGSNNGSISGGMSNNQSSPTIVNCIFSQNLSSMGAGIFNLQSSPVINNCTFSNNSSNASNSSSNNGGALYNDQSSPIITNCTFSANAATDNGGNIYNINTSAPIISYCTFSDGIAESGGAIYNNGTANNISISHCTFSNNTGWSLGGGGIYNGGSTILNLVSCTLSNNISSGLINAISAICTVDSSSFTENTNIVGGGILNEGTLNITNSSFTANSSNGYDGGGISSYSGIISLNRCIFLGNIGGMGGALHCNNSNANIENCSFLGNQTGDSYYGGGWGGGIYINNSIVTIINCLLSGNLGSNGAAISNSGSTTQIVNSTIAGNRTPYDTYSNSFGKCIYNLGSTCNITNSIVWNNQTGLVTDGFSTANVTYSLIQGLTPQPNSYNITGEPLFVNDPGYLSAPFTTGDYRLQSLSICRNRGYNDSIPSGILTDIEGNPRITGDTVDMGAYEFLLLPPVVHLGNDSAICAGSNLTLSAQNSGSSYLWNTGDTTETINVTSAGIYSVVATNSLGHSSDTIIVTLNPLPVVNLGNDTTLCAGSILDAQNPNSTYSWNNWESTQTISVNYSGNYAVTVIDTNNCRAEDSIEVVVNPLPIVNLGDDFSICDGQTAILNAENSGASYLWNNIITSQTITVTDEGNYNVAVKDTNQCVGKDTIHISVNPLPVVTLGNDTVFCSGYAAILNAQNPGSTYLWNNTATTQSISVTYSGTYTVTVTSANLCVGKDTVNITVNPSPIVHLGNDTLICTGNSITLNAQNQGFSYLWSNAATTQTINIANSGIYTVIVTDTNLCKGMDTTQVTVDPLPVVTLGSDTGICMGNILTLNAQNVGATYIWNDATTMQTLNVNTSGTYNVSVMNSNQCKGYDTIQVTINLLPVVMLGNDTSICAGNNVTLNAQNVGSTYLWNNGSTSQALEVTIGGTYYVLVTDANLCKESDTIDVTFNALPEITLGNDTALCAGNSIILDAQNVGDAYSWNNGYTTQIIETDTAGMYDVTVTGTNNCKNSDTIQISIHPLPTVSLGNDTSFCAGNTLILNAQNASATYLWSNAATTQIIDVNTSGNYYVVVKDAHQCEGGDSIAIIINALPVVNLGNDTTITTGTSITLHAGNTGSTYLWDNGAISQSITVNTSGSYSVVVTNANGCTGTDTITVHTNTVGIDPVKGENNILTVIPNPASEIINIQISNAKLLHTRGTLTDMYGHTVLTVMMECESQALSLTGLAQGIYILHMQNGQTIKIVKD